MSKISVGALLLAMPFSAALAVPIGVAEASAEVSPSYMQGTDGVGIFVGEGGDAIEVTKEVLTIDLRELSPEQGKYGKAEIVYELFNTGTENTSVTFALPLGKLPEYDVPAPSFTVTKSCRGENGWKEEAVETTVRYTYGGASSYTLSSETDEGVSFYGAEDFFRKDTPVYEYVFRAEEGTVPPNARLDIEYDYHPRRTRVAFYESAHIGIKDGYGRASVVFGAEDRAVRMYAIGEPLLDYKAVVNGGTKRSTSNADTELTAEPVRLTYEELAMRDYTVESGMSRGDWYAAFTDMLACSCTEVGGVLAPLGGFSRQCCMPWYEYSISFAAGEHLVNTVTAPLYPNVNKFGGTRYEYSYLLSPAQAWTQYNGIKINLLTSYELVVSNLAFTKTEDGYTFERDSLPLGELSFTIAASGGATPYTPYGNLSPALTTAIVMLVIVVVCAVAVVVVGIFVARRRKQKRLAEYGREQAGKAMPGEIDLEPLAERRNEENEEKRE